MSRHLLIRADANAKIGTGHVMRCLALAQAWQDEGGTVSLAARELPEALKARLKSEQVEVIPVPPGSEADDAANLVSLAKEQAECVVVDGYAFGIAHQRALREAAIRQLFIDDYGHAPEYIADFVLNQNITADESLYRNRAANTKLLLGTKYAMLRREFRSILVDSRRAPEIGRNVLVTLGGSDPENVTSQVLQALNRVDIKQLHVKAIVGVANPNRSTLQERSPGNTYYCELLENGNMPELMLWSDMAISATGTTLLELLYMKVPFVGIAWADNQRPAALKLREMGFQSFLWPEEVNSERLAKSIEALAQNQEKRKLLPCVIDGNGALRVSQLLRAPRIRVLPATTADCRLLFEWANDRTVRSASFEPRPIQWREHERWFNEKLSDPNSLVLISRNQSGEAVGQIRFDGIGGTVEIDISVSPAHRGLGYGSAILYGGIEYFRESHQESLNAFVKSENLASRSLFERCGFRCMGEVQMRGSKAIHFVLDGA